MSAYLELMRDGVLGSAGAQMLYDVVVAVAHFDRLRPLDGSQRWTQETTIEVAHDFLTDERTPRRLAAILLRATDDSSLQRLLEAAVRNYVRDRLRSTDHGAFRRKLRDVLEDDDRVRRRDEPPGEAWVLSQTPDMDPWSGDPATFDAAAWSVDALMLRWRSRSRRDPVTDRESLVNVCVAVIEAAGRPVLTTTLTEVGMRRFSLANSPVLVDLDDEPSVDGPTVTDDVVLAAEVEEILGQLTDAELVILVHWELSVRELGEVLRLGKSATSVRVGKLETKLTQLLGGREDGEAIWDVLMRSVHDWWEYRTSDSDAAFDETERNP